MTVLADNSHFQARATLTSSRQSPPSQATTRESSTAQSVPFDPENKMGGTAGEPRLGRESSDEALGRRRVLARILVL
jgi:hypothetical protein